MKIIILHGDDVNKIFERLSKFTETARERSWEVSYLDPSKGNLKEELSGISLFGSERFFILKDPKIVSKKDIEWIAEKCTNIPGNLIIYSETELTPAFLKNFPKGTKIEEFKLPKLIWSFLDNLSPGNAERGLRTFHKIIETDPPEFIFTLIAKLFRDIYWAKIDSKSLPYPPWRIGKLKSQASKFTVDQLKQFIDELANIDVAVKTGRADLVSALDLVILKQLE